MNNELNKNAEGYTDPTAAATLNKKEPGDIWGYMNNECLILKNHGTFSTCLLLGRERRHPDDVKIVTESGVRYTDPRKLTWGMHSKMFGFIETISTDDFNDVVNVVEVELGFQFPREMKQKDDWAELSEIEAQVQDLLAERDAILEHNRALKEQNMVLRDQLNDMIGLHATAVDRVNKVNFAKLKVVNQLELLQGMVGSVLAHFQVDTED